jgi:Acetyltransferase (GNAT) domain
MNLMHAKVNGVIAEVTSLFQQPWWLDAVAPGRWSAVEIRRGGELKARLPYVMDRRMGLTLLRQPLLTPFLGPWICPSEGKYATQLAHQKELYTELIEQLPAHHYFSQTFHYSVENWLPFYWKGFQQTTRYTYMINNLTDLDHVWSEFRENIRREIRKASKRLRVHSEYGIDTFFNINELTFLRQGLPLPYSRESVRRLDEACSARSARTIFFAEDDDGRVHAAVYIVWDEQSAYYLMGGGDPALRTSGAMSLALWEAIKFSHQVSRRFDFEGSMIEPIERFFRAFGACQVPYFHVSRCSRSMRVLMSARDMMKALVRH